MKKRIKVTAEVLEQIKEQHPQMVEDIKKRMDGEGRIEVREEVWNRNGGAEDKNSEPETELPEIIELGVTVGELLGIPGDKRK